MIGSLRGIILEKYLTAVLLEVHGVGYRVTLSTHALSACSSQGELFCYIHDHIREDAHELYGFLQSADMELFEQLISISGVGPKVALTILSLGTADTVCRAIMDGDLTRLTSVPGVGKKTAQKIILELKGQLVESDDASGEDHEVVEALQSLGYSASQARDVLKHVPSEITNPSDRVRQALKFLGK